MEKIKKTHFEGSIIWKIHPSIRVRKDYSCVYVYRRTRNRAHQTTRRLKLSFYRWNYTYIQWAYSAKTSQTNDTCHSFVVDSKLLLCFHFRLDLFISLKVATAVLLKKRLRSIVILLLTAWAEWRNLNWRNCEIIKSKNSSAAYELKRPVLVRSLKSINVESDGKLIHRLTVYCCLPEGT